MTVSAPAPSRDFLRNYGEGSHEFAVAAQLLNSQRSQNPASNLAQHSPSKTRWGKQGNDHHNMNTGYRIDMDGAIYRENHIVPGVADFPSY